MVRDPLVMTDTRMCSIGWELLTTLDPSQREFISIGQARLWHEERGDGQPVLLLHAGIADSRMWDEPFEALSATFRVIRFDMRGFGKTVPGPGPFTDWEDAATLLSRIGVESAIVVGVSMGARVALELALMRPEMVRGLILVSPGVFDDAPRSDGLRAGWGRIEEAFDTHDIERAIDIETAIWVDGPSRDPSSVREDVRRHVREMNARAWELQSQAEGRQDVAPPAHTRLDEVCVPTLVMAGKDDQEDIVRIANHLAHEIHDARLVTFENAAHMLTLEYPERFVLLLTDFVQELNLN